MAQVLENPPAGAVVVAVQAEENNVEDNAAAANAAPPVAQEVSLLFFMSVSNHGFVPGCIIRVCIFISPSSCSRLCHYVLSFSCIFPLSFLWVFCSTLLRGSFRSQGRVFHFIIAFSLPLCYF